LRDPVGIIAVRVRIDTAEKSEFQSADKRRAVRKNERITHRPPKNRNQAGNAETLRQDRQDVFCADEAAVKQGQAGKGHEEHERSAGHHPGVVRGTRSGNV